MVNGNECNYDSTNDMETSVSEVYGHKAINRKSKEYRLSKVIFDKRVRDGVITPLTHDQKVEHTRLKWVRPTEEQFHKGVKWPKSHREKKRSEGYGKMTTDQKKHFVDLMANGIGKAFACDQCGVTWRVFQEAYNSDEDFRIEVGHKQQSALDVLDADIYQSSIDPNAPISDKIAARRIIMDVRIKSDAQKLNKRLLKLKEMEVRSKVKAVDHVIGSHDVNMSNLSFEELEQYNSLLSRIKNDEELTDEQIIEYGRLAVKSSKPARPNQLMQADMNKLTMVRDIFSDDDED